MSAAELTARKVYREYNLGTLSEDVKRQLMILFLSQPTVIDNETSTLPTVPVEVLRARAEESYQEAVRGKGRPIDDLLDEMSSKYLQ